MARKGQVAYTVLGWDKKESKNVPLGTAKLVKSASQKNHDGDRQYWDVQLEIVDGEFSEKITENVEVDLDTVVSMTEYLEDHNIEVPDDLDSEETTEK